MKHRVLDDHYTRLARKQGYAARSAYKLKQIQDARDLIRPGAAVLDLGCAPGAWLQVASELVGPRGAVVGIDLKPVRIPLRAGVTALEGDIYETPPSGLLAPLGGGRLFDVALSDMAPSTSGHNDHELSARLADRVLDLLAQLLRPGGNLAVKVFEGWMYPDLLARAGEMFEQSRGYKPKASRDVSREMYIVGKGFRAPTGAD